MLQEEGISVEVTGLNKPLILHPFWLRDHCRCPECYNSITSQRKFDILKLSDDLKISKIEQCGDKVDVKWSDGHASTYSASWLVNNTYEGRYQNPPDGLPHTVRTTWDGETLIRLGLESIKHADVMTDSADNNAVAEVYRRVIRYGFAIIDGVPVTESDTKAVLERICRMSSTVFGTYWETGVKFDHKDTGYTNEYLEAHTDNTYFSEAQGYLAFHCTHFRATGSENFLVDGFHVAKQLKDANPEAYHFLSEKSAEAEYIEPNEHFVHCGPTFRHHPVTGEVEQIRLNMLDRAPLSTLPQSEVAIYYKHLQSLLSVVRRKENEFRFLLTPGTVLIFDNWRMLHGRDYYEGRRVLQGCYYTRSDFMSRARNLGIIR